MICLTVLKRLILTKMTATLRLIGQGEHAVTPNTSHIANLPVSNLDKSFLRKHTRLTVCIMRKTRKLEQEGAHVAPSLSPSILESFSALRTKRLGAQ